MVGAGSQAARPGVTVSQGATAPSGVERGKLEPGTAVVIVGEEVATAGEVW